MDLKHLVLLALTLSLILTVFSFGLGATLDDLLYLVRRPGLLARSLLSMFVVVPLAILGITAASSFPATVEIWLLALSVSPLPPILPRKMRKGGVRSGYPVALLATVSTLSIAIVPLGVDLMGRWFGRPFAMPPSAVAPVMLKMVLLPLFAGMVVRRLTPGGAARLEKPAGVIGGVVLASAAVILVGSQLQTLWALVGQGAMLGILGFAVVGLVAGHLLAGSDVEQQDVLAVSSACRHPGIALAVATANFPDGQFGPPIILYLLVNAILMLPYLKWQESRLAAASRATA